MWRIFGATLAGGALIVIGDGFRNFVDGILIAAGLATIALPHALWHAH